MKRPLYSVLAWLQSRAEQTAKKYISNLAGGGNADSTGMPFSPTLTFHFPTPPFLLKQSFLLSGLSTACYSPSQTQSFCISSSPSYVYFADAMAENTKFNAKNLAY